MHTRRCTSRLVLVATGVALSACGGSIGDASTDAGPAFGVLEGAIMSCFYKEDDPDQPAATIEYLLEVFDEGELLRTRLTFSPEFVDNTYGVHAVGWSDVKKGTHTFKDLYGSDHAQLIYSDTSGADVLDFKMDYLSENPLTPSGYGSLGVAGGDGKVIDGDAASIRRVATSLDRNLNDRGLSSYLEDSPRTDASYVAPAEAADWNYRVMYEVWVATSAFGSAGFDAVRLDFVHASPSKTGNNTEPVERSPCPEDWCPGGCTGEPAPGGSGEEPEDSPPGNPPV